MKAKQEAVPQVIPRGIYLLPSLMTLLNMFCGFYAIILVIIHFHDAAPEIFFVRAAYLIVLAGVFDALDGRIARMTKTTSPFGAQLDSIADVVSFGLAPGILVYCWALEGFHRFGWIPAFLFLACGAIRLARFNVLADSFDYSSKRYFIGLPIPAAAGSLATLVLLIPRVESRSFMAFLILMSVYLISFLMVSKLRFRSFKDFEWRRRKPVGMLFLFLIILIVFLHEPSTILFLLAVSYIMTGILAEILPEATLNFFRKLDIFMHDVKILDDADTDDEVLMVPPEVNGIDVPETPAEINGDASKS